jgi:hypothetical protein
LHSEETLHNAHTLEKGTSARFLARKDSFEEEGLNSILFEYISGSAEDFGPWNEPFFSVLEGLLVQKIKSLMNT